MEDLIRTAMDRMAEMEQLRGALFGLLGVGIVIPIRILIARLRKYENIVTQGELRLIAIGLAGFLGIFIGACGLLDESHSTHVAIQAVSMIVIANGGRVKKKEKESGDAKDVL